MRVDFGLVGVREKGWEGKTKEGKVGKQVSLKAEYIGLYVLVAIESFTNK
jgi:hypothetical protein